ncbi:MAG: hypothetical protein QOE06_587 [Thermoleophilaceae bacterium]|nr:hypothetical protein [Thermoleophilaceae bacterium]
MSGRTSGQGDPRPLLVGAEWFPDTAGGLNRTFRVLFLGLAEAGVEPRALVVGPVSDPAPGLVEVPFGPLALRLGRMLAVAIRLRSRTDVVDVHFALYGVAGALGARLGGSPLVVHFHGPWADESALQGGQRSLRLRAKRALERAVYRRGERHVVHTFAFRRLLVERYGVLPWNFEIVPPAVNLEQFTPGGRAEARERLGIAAGVPVAVSVRRLTPRMGLDDAIRAWSRLAGHEALLLLAGRGPDRPRLEALARELGVAARVRFLGSVPDADLADVYRAADLCVVPSTALEGFGLVAIEALACGTPVVVSDTGGLPEAVLGLGDDLVVPAGDPGALAERLDAAFDGTRPLPGPERCREHAELFTPERMIQSHRDLYARALAPSTRRRRVVYVDRSPGDSMGAEEAVAMAGAVHDADVHMLLGADGPFAAAIQRSGVSMEVLPGGASDRLYPVRLARRLRALQPDVLHSISKRGGRGDRAAARLAGVPCASSS